MNILIPVYIKEDNDINIASLNSVQKWVFVSLKDGTTKEIKTFDKKENIKDLIDFVVVKDKDEDIDEFLDEGIDVLVAPFQRSVEEIVEAYMFKELYEI